jgi:hypothetical protein
MRLKAVIDCDKSTRTSSRLVPPDAVGLSSAVKMVCGPRSVEGTVPVLAHVRSNGRYCATDPLAATARKALLPKATMDAIVSFRAFVLFRGNPS